MSCLSPGSTDPVRTDGEDQTLGKRTPTKAKDGSRPIHCRPARPLSSRSPFGKDATAMGAAKHLNSPGNGVKQACAVASISFPTTWLRPVTARSHHGAPNPARMKPFAWSNPERGWPSAMPLASSWAARGDV